MKIEESHTFNEWIELGRIVCKGEKSTSKNLEGVALFTKSQTKNPKAVINLKSKLLEAIDSAWDYPDKWDEMVDYDGKYIEWKDPFFNKTLHEDHYEENNFTGYSG